MAHNLSRTAVRLGAAVAAGAGVLGLDSSTPALNAAAPDSLSRQRSKLLAQPESLSKQRSSLLAPTTLSRNALTNVSPLDGRYARTTASLCHYFSEFSYMKYRTQVEIEYFIALHDVLPQLQKSPLSEEQKMQLREVYTGFSIEDGNTIKATERITNHDVKAVEYFVKVVQQL